MRRRTRSGREFPLLMWLLLLSWAREETTMMSRKDRVVRTRTNPDTMPEQRSRKKFTWVSVTKENSRTRSIRTISGSKEADQCSNSDRSSKRVRFNRIDHRTTESGLTDCNRWAECLWSEGLPVWPMPKDQSSEWRKVSGAKSWLSSECELNSSSLPANRLRWSRCEAGYAVLEAEWGLSSAGEGDLELTLVFFLAGLLWRKEEESEETEEDEEEGDGELLFLLCFFSRLSRLDERDLECFFFFF